MKRYKHFLLTRFNIPFIRKNNIDFLFQSNYLSERYQLFLKFCYPSVKKQLNQDFIWLVFFDKRTPSKYVALNRRLSNEYNIFTPVYVDFEEYLNDRSISDTDYANIISKNILPTIINQEIIKYIDQNTDYIITSRIDNDDALNCNFISNIQEYILSTKIEEEIVLSFKSGLQYLDNSCIIQAIEYPNNHFLTLIEKKTDRINTIFFWDHYFIQKYKRIVFLNLDKAWIEIVHNNNVVNTFSFDKKNKLILRFCLFDYGFEKRWGILQSLIQIVFSPNKYLFHLIKYKIKNIYKYGRKGYMDR